MMKRIGMFLVMVSLAGVQLGCEVVVGPPRGGVVIAPAPPPVVAISARPRLVFMADYGIYVAPDVHYDIFYDGSGWFYFSSGHWYRGTHYNGPWVLVDRGIPPGLMKVPPGKLKKMALKVKHQKSMGPGKSDKKRGRQFK